MAAVFAVLVCGRSEPASPALARLGRPIVRTMALGATPAARSSAAAGLAAAVAGLTLIRLVVGATAPLAPDETYYWVWSHALALGYLDHPPMVALWIRAGTALLGETALGVRLLGPLAAALASWMLYDAARALFPGHPTGVAAVMLLNSTLLLGVGTVIITPDLPLLFFWTATLWAMARIVAGRSGARWLVPAGNGARIVAGQGAARGLPAGGGFWWLAAGLFGGLALDSKYTALFLWVGIGLWVLLVPAVRPWLRRWQPWVACCIGLVLFTPVLAWNASHQWVGLARQGSRVGDWQPARSAGFLAELVGGQIGLATPLVWTLCIAGLIAAIRRTWSERDPRWALLVALSLPPLLVFVQHAFGDRVQGNWPAIIYPALTIACGELAVAKRWCAAAAAALGFTITGLVYVQVATSLIPLPPRLDPIAIRLAGWDGLSRQIDTARIATGAAYVAADSYGLTSELAWWLPSATMVVGTDERWNLTRLPRASITGRQGLLVRDARRTDPVDPVAWTDVQPIGTAARPGAAGSDFMLYRVTAAAAPAGWFELPRR